MKGKLILSIASLMIIASAFIVMATEMRVPVGEGWNLIYV